MDLNNEKEEIKKLINEYPKGLYELFEKFEKASDELKNDKGLCLEARQKLNKQKPLSVGQASRISGVSPSDISVLLIYLNQLKRKGDKFSHENN